MGFFEDIVGKIFGKQEQRQPLVHEVLERSEKELASYERWLMSDSSKELISDFDRAYSLKMKQVESSLAVHLLQSKYANGFALSYNEQIGAENFQHFFDYLKNIVEPQGYRVAQADRKLKVKGEAEEEIEKWYLKPLADDLSAQLIDQRFGNILIEKVSINRKPSYIKLMANIYQDRLYTKAKPFEELYQQLITR
jgi:hypothetical protein